MATARANSESVVRALMLPPPVDRSLEVCSLPLIMASTLPRCRLVGVWGLLLSPLDSFSMESTLPRCRLPGVVGSADSDRWLGFYDPARASRCASSCRASKRVAAAAISLACACTVRTSSLRNGTPGLSLPREENLL